MYDFSLTRHYEDDRTPEIHVLILDDNTNLFVEKNRVDISDWLAWI
jgi:hypothetical protein